MILSHLRKVYHISGLIPTLSECYSVDPKLKEYRGLNIPLSPVGPRAQIPNPIEHDLCFKETIVACTHLIWHYNGLARLVLVHLC